MLNKYMDDMFNQMSESASVIKSISPTKIIEISEMIIECIKRGGKIYIAGNGGSASDADHFVGEMLGRFKLERCAFPAISLCSNIGALTAISNDYSYDSAFARQLRGLMTEDKDLFIGISTSGKSKNILKCLHVADLMNCPAIMLTGKYEKINKDVPYNTTIVSVYSDVTARIQEAHGVIIHLVCDIVERELSKEYEQ